MRKEEGRRSGQRYGAHNAPRFREESRHVSCVVSPTGLVVNSCRCAFRVLSGAIYRRFVAFLCRTRKPSTGAAEEFFIVGICAVAAIYLAAHVLVALGGWRGVALGAGLALGWLALRQLWRSTKAGRR